MAVALALAFAGGYVARRLGAPPVIGYLAAGLILSPFTPGYDADLETLRAVAELGVIFLMFGIGLHFDLEDIAEVRGVAIPGALGSITLMTAAGFGIASLLGLDAKEALVVALAVSVCSGAVMSRTLADRGLISSIPGRIAIGWSVVEDLATVLFIALLPLLAGDSGNIFEEAGIALGKASLFLVIMLFLGARLVPVLLRRAAGTGSRELFILGVVACALGIASGATLFDVSVALGAFVAGVAISETEMGHQATADVLPLREAFAVLFFVSIGTLVEPEALLDNVPLLLGLTALIVAGKTAIVTGLFAFFPYPGRAALFVGASIAQIGEFSFLIAQAGIDEDLISNDTYNVVLGASMLSIAVNPLWFRAILPAERALQIVGPIWRRLDRQGPVPVAGPTRPNHVIIMGYGRVGELTGHALQSLDVPYVVIEENLERARRLSNAGMNVVWGDAASTQILEEASIEYASLVVIALPDENSTILAVQNARKLAPYVPVIARARVQEEVEILGQLGANESVVPEYEGGLELMRRALVHLGYPEEEVEVFRAAMREVHYGAVPHA